MDLLQCMVCPQQNHTSVRIAGAIGITIPIATPTIITLVRIKANFIDAATTGLCGYLYQGGIVPYT